MNADRCQAAHRTDSSPCQGSGQAVQLRSGNRVRLGCVHHAARMKATVGSVSVLVGPHGYTGYSWGDSAAHEALRRAEQLTPYDWQQTA
ncbi:hypothetical protein [Streptomyces sp. NPDC002402]